MTPKGHFETNWPLVTFVFDYRLSLVGTYLECQICCWYSKERFCGHERSTEKRIGNMGQLNSLVVFSDAIFSRQISPNFVGSPPHCIKILKKILTTPITNNFTPSGIHNTSKVIHTKYSNHLPCIVLCIKLLFI